MTTDVYPPDKRSAVMAQVKGRDTAPERIVRKLLWGLGARYRLHAKALPGKPDIVMAGRRLGRNGIEDRHSITERLFDGL